MKIITKYITKNFLITFVVVLFFAIFLFVLSDFFSKLGSILKSSVSFKYVVEYYFFYIPFLIYFSLPLIYALSSVISLGYLSFRNEIIVMRSSGLSIFKIALPVMVISFLMSCIMFLGKERIVNYSLDRANYIKNFYLENESLKSVWLKIGSYFVRTEKVDLNEKKLFGVVCYKVDNNFTNINEILSAKRAFFKGKDLVLLQVEDTIMPDRIKKHYNRFVLKGKEPFISLVSSSKFKEPSIVQLFRGYRLGKNKDYYLSLILSRFLYPLSCVVLTLISLIFVLKITPRKSGFIANVFYAAIVFIVFIIGFQLVVTMGKYSMVNPILSLLIFMLFWIAISLYNLLKLGA